MSSWGATPNFRENNETDISTPNAETEKHGQKHETV